MPHILRIDDEILDFDELRIAIRQAILARLHGIPRAIRCDCHENAFLKVVSSTRNGSGVNSYSLANYPHSAELHHEGCRYRRFWKKGKRKSAPASPKTLYRTVDGRTKLTIQDPLFRGVHEEGENENTPVDRGGNVRKSPQRKGGALGTVTRYVMNLAGAFMRKPYEGKPDWNSVGERIEKGIDSCDLNEVPLREVLIVPRSGNRQETDSKIVGLIWATSDCVKPRKLILGVIEKVETAPDGGVRVRLEYCDRDILVDKDTWARIRKSSWSSHAAGAVRALGKNRLSGKALFTALVEKDDLQQIRAVKGALTVTSSVLMPVQSWGELKVANALEAHGHVYRKPIDFYRMKRIEPDFVVHLGYDLLYVEVAGLSRAGYVLHTMEKLRIYSKQGVGIWVYWIGLPEPMPTIEPQSLESVLERGQRVLNRNKDPQVETSAE